MNAKFSYRAASTNLFDLAGVHLPKLLGSVPGIPRTAANVGTTVTGLTAATARWSGMVTATEAATAFVTNGGWVANLSPSGVLISVGMNSVVSGAAGYAAFHVGAAVGAAAYATGQTIAGSCQ